MDALMQNKKFLLAGVAVAVMAAGALYVGGVYPPAGDQAAGTIAPAERFHAPQVQATDVKLGDQGTAKLMQTDAFEAMSKDPSFRALASDPAFMALAKQPGALEALAMAPQAFAALAKHPNAFEAMAKNAKAFDAAGADAQEAHQVGHQSTPTWPAERAVLVRCTSPWAS